MLLVPRGLTKAIKGKGLRVLFKIVKKIIIS